jgi:AcrR family transcriptional regulator
MEATTVRPGLRERKKERTRRTIVEVGTRLFVEQGYSETTLAQIADSAEIAPSTFFNYFPSKVAIVFGLFDAILASAEECVLNRPLETPAMEALLSWITDDLPAVEVPYSEALRSIPKIVASVPELRAEERLREALLEDMFAASFARDFGESADSLRPRVMAAIAFRGILEVWNSWYTQHASDLEFRVADVLSLKAEYLERALTAGLEAVRLLPGLPPDH